MYDITSLVLYTVFLLMGCEYIAGSKNKIHFGTVLGCQSAQIHQYGPPSYASRAVFTDMGRIDDLRLPLLCFFINIFVYNK